MLSGLFASLVDECIYYNLILYMNNSKSILNKSINNTESEIRITHLVFFSTPKSRQSTRISNYTTQYACW